LPQTVDGQPVLWNPRGLRPLGDEIPLPDAAQANGQEASDYRGYELVDDRFEAIRSPAKNAVGEPRVVLADVLVAAERSGQYLGLAMFDLIPEGLDSCSVEFPAGLEPVLITIDQQPQRLPVASPPSGDDEQPKDTSQSDMKRQRPNKQRRAANQQPETKRQRVDLWLLSSEQPQQIRVMFRGHAELSEQTGGQLQMPHLAIRNAAESDLAGKPISVDQTLWTIQMPQGLGQLTTWQIGGDPADWATQQRMRQSRLIAAADFVERKAVELAPRDLATWYSRWCDRLVASSRQTRVLAALDPAADWTASEELLEKTYREQTERAGRLQNEAIWQRATAQDQAIDMNGVWHRAVGLTRPTAYRAFEGSKEALPWKIASTPSPWPPRLLAMGLVLLTAVGLQRWPSSATWLSYRWPGLWGVLLGIGWWLFLQPSIFGWVIVGLSLLLTALLR
jgi:hypothetical protein